MTKYLTSFNSSIGIIGIGASDKGIEKVAFSDRPWETSQIIPGMLKECEDQLKAYFAGTLKQFTVPLDLQGSAFEISVWEELCRIPFGVTRSYYYIAKKLDNPKGVRAVGLANARNPVAIIVPCHRVIGSNGKLTGYAGGVWRKEWLLKHEDAII